MDRTFDPDKFIARIGQRLVEQFDDAKAATSPGTVGNAMEQPVRDQLEQILPRGIAVGEGFVIDSEGGTSRQTDVILYEKDICPVFSVNNTPETTYYPCEGVIAVGEVKSTLDRGSLEDAFTKISSVKQLRRHPTYHPVPFPDGNRPIYTRGYGTVHPESILTVTEDQEVAETAQIFGFVIAGDIRIQNKTFCDAFKEFSLATGDQLCPNLVSILSGSILGWGNITKLKHREIQWSDRKKGYTLAETTSSQTGWERSWSAQKAEFFLFSQEGESFRTLIRWIWEVYRTGKTSDAQAFDRYFLRKDNPVPLEQMIVPKSNMTEGEVAKILGTG